MGILFNERPAGEYLLVFSTGVPVKRKRKRINAPKFIFRAAKNRFK